MKKLSELLKKVDIEISPEQDIEILDIVYDSREVKPGSLFICLTGANVDGHDFVDKAVANGAAAILVEKKSADFQNYIYQVPNTRVAMQKIVPYFFDYPAQKMKLIGVTGTNGKTTTTNLIAHILCKAGYKVGLIGTIEVRYANQVIISKNTTPDVIDLQRILYKMQLAGIEYVVMEVSSHALELNRVAGCCFDIGVLTNITQDHLDYHKTFENYVLAKAILFSNLEQKDNTVAIFNNDDSSTKILLEKSSASFQRTYSLQSNSDIYPVAYELGMDSMHLKLNTPQGLLETSVATTGLFNVYNVMAAVATTLNCGVSIDVIVMALREFKSVAGRFELVKAGQPFTVVVDYAHTPDGLENVLKTARDITKGRLIVVFGCGGNRDKTKRPKMAAIAEKLADIIVITSDNPRKEDPEQILLDVQAGLKKPNSGNCHKILDRRQAIATALKLAKARDIVLIAGKGHETYQILRDETIHFDDCEVARGVLEELGYVKK